MPMALRIPVDEEVKEKPQSQNTHNTRRHTDAQTHTNTFYIHTAALNHPF